MGISNAQEDINQGNKKPLKEDKNNRLFAEVHKKSCLEGGIQRESEIELTCINMVDNLCNSDRLKRKVNFVEIQQDGEKNKRISNKRDLVARKENQLDVDLHKSSEELFFMLKLENENASEIISSLEKVNEISNFTISGRKKVHEFLLNLICTSLTRPQGRLYYLCDRDKISDQKSSSFHLFGRAFAILEKIFMKESKKTESLHFLDFGDVRRCLNLLRSEDLRIRTLAKRFIQEVYNRHTKMRYCIKCKVKSILISIIHEQVEPVGINELLNLSTYILVSDGFRDSLEAQCYFSECIFPILRINNAHLYEQELKTAFEAFSQLANDCFLYTFKQLSKAFFDVNSNVRISILNFCSSIIQVKQTTMNFRYIEDYTCKIVSSCLTNAHCILISHLLTFIKEKTMYSFLKANSSTFIPKVFDDVYDLSKNYWNKDRSPEVYSIVTVVMSLDKNMFEECLKRYNFKRYKQRIENDVSEDVVRCFGQDLLRESEGVSGIRRKSLPHEGKGHKK